MFDSLRLRILLVVGGVVLLTVGAIFFFTQSAVERAAFEAADKHAQDLTNAVLLTVENEYESLLFHRSATLQRRKSELKNIVNLAMVHVYESYRLYAEGILSEKQAQAKVMAQLRRARYDEGTGYLWISDLREPLPRLLMHPVLPELEGKILTGPEYYTAAGVSQHLLQAFAEVGREKGEGYVEYLWPKPTEEGISTNQPKMSYVKLFEKWGWVVGTGVYIDDIEEDIRKRLEAIRNELTHTFAKVRVAESGYMYVFDGDKNMLIHPSLTGIDVRTMKNPATGNPLIDEIIEASKTPAVPYDYIWDKPGHEGNFHFQKRAYVTYFEPLDWYIVSTMYLDEIAKPGIMLRGRILILCLFSLAAAFVLSLFLSRSLTEPLRALMQAARGIEEGGVAGARIPVDGTVETRRLGILLDEMIRSIGKALADKDEALGALRAGNESLEKEISERKEVEAALSSAHRRLQDIIEFLPDATFVIDREKKVIAWNKAMEEMTGVLKQEMIGQGGYAYAIPFYGKRRPFLLDLIGSPELEKEGEYISVEKRGETLFVESGFLPCAYDGKGAYFWAAASRLFDTEGNCVGAIESIRDITDRKRGEEALKKALADAEEAREKIDAILKSVSDGLIVTDMKHRVVLMNRTAEDWLGLPMREAYFRPIESLLADEAFEAQICAVLRGEAAGAPVEWEMPGTEPNLRRVVYASTAPVRGEGKGTSGTITILRDVTREREVERIKREFLSTAAHELLTPLTSVMGYAEFLLNPEEIGDFPLERRQEFLATIYNKAMELSHIVDDLLNLSRIESGRRIPIKKKACDMKDVVVSLVARFEKECPGWSFMTILPEASLEVLADEEKIVQVLEEILSNAVKFSPEGGLIEVSCESSEAEIRIAVRDEGIGMTAEEVNRVFDKFYRVDASTTAKGGLGLGMSVVKAVVEAHGGVIRVESEPGSGTRVSFSLSLGNHNH